MRWECLLKDKLPDKLLQCNISRAAEDWCVGKQQKWTPHPPYRRGARGRCNIHTDHHPGNSGCGCLSPANGWRAAAAKVRIELGAQQRLEKKDGGRWMGESGRGTRQSSASSFGCFPRTWNAAVPAPNPGRHKLVCIIFNFFFNRESRIAPRDLLKHFFFTFFPKKRERRKKQKTGEFN